MSYDQIFCRRLEVKILQDLLERISYNKNGWYLIDQNAYKKMLFYKLEDYYSYLVPFLVLLHRLPDRVNIGRIVYTSDIPLDMHIVEVLRKI